MIEIRKAKEGEILACYKVIEDAKRVFKENGLNMPRNSVSQSLVGKSVSLSNARKGDLIFFDTDRDGSINHVSIVINSNSIIHAASSQGVTISSFNSYWSSRVVKVMRVI